VTHPQVVAAAAGKLPPWARISAKRRRHVRRVVELLATWADVAAVSPEERTRWLAAGWLHDALKDADNRTLKRFLGKGDRKLPAAVLHGPAAAAALRGEGVEDEELLRAIAFHSLGHPDFGRTGKILYAADFLEPGRENDRVWRKKLRARMPGKLDPVVQEIVRARIEYLLRKGRSIRPETAEFWNRMARGGG